MSGGSRDSETTDESVAPDGEPSEVHDVITVTAPGMSPIADRNAPGSAERGCATVRPSRGCITGLLLMLIPDPNFLAVLEYVVDFYRRQFVDCHGIRVAVQND